MKTKQLMDRLEELNPGLEFVKADHHHKIIYRGRFVGILPFKLAREGLAHNTKTQLKREGVRLA